MRTIKFINSPFGQMCFELDIEFGGYPLWKVAKLGRETIIDLPFLRIIHTPRDYKGPWEE